MLKIRLRRVGAKKQPSYRVVVADSRSPQKGRFVEIVGFYNPRTEPPTVELKEERLRYWLSQGAQPTDAVLRLLEKQGLVDGTARAEKWAKAAAAVEEAEEAAEAVEAVEEAEEAAEAVEAVEEVEEAEEVAEAVEAVEEVEEAEEVAEVVEAVEEAEEVAEAEEVEEEAQEASA